MFHSSCRIYFITSKGAAARGKCNLRFIPIGITSWARDCGCWKKARKPISSMSTLRLLLFQRCDLAMIAPINVKWVTFTILLQDQQVKNSNKYLKWDDDEENTATGLERDSNETGVMLGDAAGSLRIQEIAHNSLTLCSPAWEYTLLFL